MTNRVLDETVTSIIVSEAATLLIYQNTTLKWSSKLNNIPVSLKRANFQTINGILVFLSDAGRLECGYLGTEPSLFVAPPMPNQELDFDQAGLELATLNRTIKKSYSNGKCPKQNVHIGKCCVSTPHFSKINSWFRVYQQKQLFSCTNCRCKSNERFNRARTGHKYFAAHFRKFANRRK